jgi:hypothetical protein
MKSRLVIITWVFLLSSASIFASESSAVFPKDSMNKLLTKIDTLELKYVIWGCECPNWIAVSDYRLADKKGNLIRYCIYLEPTQKDFKLPDSFDPEKHMLKVVGQFYEKEAIPEELIGSEEQPGKAKIFRFSSSEIINN